MATDLKKHTRYPRISGVVFTIPDGFTMAVLTNDSATPIVLTNVEGETYELKENETFLWSECGNSYRQIVVDASGSTGRLAYST